MGNLRSTIKAVFDALPSTGTVTGTAMSKTINESKYCVAAPAVFADFWILKNMEENATASTAVTKITTAADALIAAGDTTIELTGATILYYLAAKNEAFAAGATKTSNVTDLGSLADAFSACTKQLYNSGGSVANKARVDTCNKALLYLTMQTGAGTALTVDTMSAALTNGTKVI